MKSVLILGLGGSGASVADCFFTTRTNRENISFLAIDSDIEATSRIVNIPTLCLTEYTSLGNAIEKLDKKTVSEWFPCDDSQGKVGFIKMLEMGRGANGWRMKGLLSFEYMLSDSEKRTVFLSALDRLIDKDNPNNQIEIIIVSSVVGGTGSALFMPVAMYIKRYFRSMYNRDVTVKAFLSCPDVYVDALTAENKVKAYANAYAALAELNAVDLTSKGYNEKARAECRCKIGLKIGSEKSKGIGVLFDASKPEFAVASAQPFANVYLFDRIPGTSTIVAHERIMAKILGIIADEDRNNSDSEIYAGISIAETVFAGESIVDYVAKRKVFEEIENEWLSLYRAAQKDIADDFGVDDIYRFAKGFTNCYKSLYTKNTYNQHLALNREKEEEGFVPEVEYKEPVVPVEHIRNYTQTLADWFYSLIKNDASQRADEALKSKDEDIHPIKLLDSKAKKRQKLAAVVDKAEEYDQILLSYFKCGTKAVNVNQDRIKTVLLDCRNEKSLVNNLLTVNGKFLHPVTALLLLCDMYKEIKDNTAQEIESCRAYGEIYEGDKLPNFVLNAVKLNSSANAEYAKLGLMRLHTLATSDADNLSLKLVDAFVDIKRDFSSIYNSITSKFVACFFAKTLSVLAEMIKKYMAVFDTMPLVLADHKVDIKLALIANTSDTCTLMNVGCTEETKEQAYASYIKEKSADYSCDEYTGKIFYEYTGKENVEGIFDDLVEEEKKEIQKGSALKEVCGLNIFRVLHDRDLFKEKLPEKSEYNDFKKAFSLVALPLDLSLKDEDTNAAANIETVTMVPVAAAEFARERLNNTELSLQQVVERYLFIQGNFETHLTVADNVPQNKLFATKKIYGFCPHLFNKLNELNENPVYYKNYKKALSVKREQATQMWNPHLVKERVGDFLPFINPVKRNAFEKNVYKAGLYMLQSGALLVEPDEGNHDVFYYVQGEQKTEIICENKQVLYRHPEQLFGYIRENAELAEMFGGAFDRELEKEISLLPAIGFEKADLPKFKQAILNGRTLKFLRNNLMENVRSAKALKSKNFVEFIYDASEKENAAIEAVNLGKTVSEIIKEFVYSRPLSNDDLYDYLYREIVGELQREYEQRAKKSGQKLYTQKSQRAFSLINAE